PKPELALNPLISRYRPKSPSPLPPLKSNLNQSFIANPGVKSVPGFLNNLAAIPNENHGQTLINSAASNSNQTKSAHCRYLNSNSEKQSTNAETATNVNLSSTGKRRPIATTELTTVKRCKLHAFESLLEPGQLTLHDIIKPSSSDQKLESNHALDLVDSLFDELPQIFDTSATKQGYHTIRDTWEFGNQNRKMFESSFQFIGNIDSLWIIKHESSLIAVDSIKAQYPHIFSKLMKSYEFPLTTLEVPIPISPNSIGGLVNLDFLSKLESTVEGYRHKIQDRRLLANGFGVCLVKGKVDSIPSVRLISPNYFCKLRSCSKGTSYRSDFYDFAVTNS
ncbi:ATP-binding mismatch repair protein, variant 2, partial [Basidiobolus ranarum]